MDRWKAEQGRGREKRKIRRKEDGDARKGRKVAKHCVFPMICGSGGSKSRLAKAAGAEPAGQISDEKLHAVVAQSRFPSQNVQNTPVSEVEMSKKCTPLWREAHFQVKMYKTHHCRTTFGSSGVEKVHAVVARSTFLSQNVQNTPLSDHFWKFRCRKSARRCGAKHISKSKCTKHTRFGSLLEVQMSKKCTPLWREAHFQVKMYKTPHVCATFEVRMSKKCTPLWREGHFEVKMVKTPGVRTTFGGSDVASLRFTTLHYITQHYNYNYTTTLHYTPLHSTTLNYTTIHYITLHSTTLHCITLHYTTFQYTSLHYTTLHSTTLQLQLELQLQLHNYTTTLHYNTLHYTTLNYTTLHYTTLRSTTLHYITLHYTTLHYTSLHYTTLHSTTNITTTTQLHSTTLRNITLNDAAPQIDR